jgi:hypothetical protein
MIKPKRGTLNFGGSLTNFEPQDIDLSLPDEEVFKLAVIDAANATGYPFRVREMSKNGSVSRSDLGRVYIAGEGWNIEFKSPEYIAEFQRCNDNRDWVKMATITQFDSFTEFNKTGSTKK